MWHHGVPHWHDSPTAEHDSPAAEHDSAALGQRRASTERRRSSDRALEGDILETDQRSPRAEAGFPSVEIAPSPQQTHRSHRSEIDLPSRRVRGPLDHG